MSLVSLALLAGQVAGGPLAEARAAKGDTSTDLYGLWSFGYWWYSELRQPSLKSEYAECGGSDGFDVESYYGYGLTAFCEFLGLCVA